MTVFTIENKRYGTLFSIVFVLYLKELIIEKNLYPYYVLHR